MLLAACSSARPATTRERDLEARRKQLADLISEQWEYTLRTNPEFASILGDLRYNDKLSDVTEKAVLADLEQARQFAARFSAVDTTGFPEQEALNKTLMLRRLERSLDSAVFENWLMPVTQFDGLHINAPQLVSLLRFQTVKDYDDYLARLTALPKVFDDVAALMRKGMDKKLIPPRILLEKVARQAQAVAAGKPEESPFAAPLRKFGAGIPEAEQTRLRAAMLEAIDRRVNPAYRKFAAFVKDEYAPNGRADPGLWSLPLGQERYAFLVKDNTTTEMKPEEIHQLGLREVARIEGEMIGIASKLGYSDLRSFNAAVEKNPDLRPRSRKEMLDLYRKYTDQIYARLPQLFGRLPKAKVEILPVEDFREKEAAGAQYNQGTPTGRGPGT